MQRLALTVVSMCLTASALLLAGVSFAADEKPPEEAGPKEIDWKGLRLLFNAGKYGEAATAADAIVTAVRPKRKAPDFLLKSVETIDALMRRGFAELQLGKLDAAEATFLEVNGIFKDRDLPPLLAKMERLGGPAAVDPLIGFDLRLLELHHLRSAVVLEQLRRIAALQPQEGDAAQEVSAGLVAEVQKSIEAIQGCLISAAAARTKLSERFDKGGETIVSSPHKRALMSGFYPELIVGITAFELSHLAFGVPQVMAPENAQKTEIAPTLRTLDGLGSSQLLEKALAHLEAASKVLDQVIKEAKEPKEPTEAKEPKEAKPKGVASARPGTRIEADVVRMETNVLLTQLHLARCAAVLRAGDLAAARKEVDEVLKLHKEMEKIRRVAKPEPHPDLFVPLLLTAEISAIEAEGLARVGKAEEARVVAARAADELARATALPLLADHPRRQGLSKVAMLLEQQRAQAEASVATSDSAEVAAGRLQRAVEATAPSASGF